MSLYRDEGVVLRAQKLGEADRIVTLLTREHGRVRAVAKGVRKTTSRLGARVEPFMLVDVQLYEGRSLDIVTQAETIGPTARHRLRLRPLHRGHRDARDRRAADRDRARAGAAAVPSARRRAAHPRRGPRATRPGARRLPAALARGRGLGAELRRLRPVRGARPAPRLRHRRPAARSARSAARRLGGARTRETFVLLAALLSGDWAVADASEGRRRREASGIVAAYLQWHLERQVRSLRLVER